MFPSQLYLYPGDVTLATVLCFGRNNAIRPGDSLSLKEDRDKDENVDYSTTFRLQMKLGSNMLFACIPVAAVLIFIYNITGMRNLGRLSCVC